MSYSFPKNAKDGDKITLENGVEYIFQQNKDRWVVNSVTDSLGEELATKEHVDAADTRLQIQIDELEQEIDVIAPRLDAAQYNYTDSAAVRPGQMHIVSGTFTGSDDVILFNDEALDGNVHTWASVDVGEYIEITDTAENKIRTADNYAMYLVTKAPEGDGMKQIEVSVVKGQGAPVVGDVMDVKAFELGSNEINDLDDRYLRNGDETTLSNKTTLLAGKNKYLNVQAAPDNDGGFLVFRDDSGNNVFYAENSGMVKLKAGRMAEHEDEITTKRYVDSKVVSSGATFPGRRFKFAGYGQGTAVSSGRFSPNSEGNTTQDLFISVEDQDGLRITEGSPDFTPGVTMPITIYTFSNGRWQSIGFGTWGGSSTDYQSQYIKLRGMTWRQKPVLSVNVVYAIVVGGKW